MRQGYVNNISTFALEAALTATKGLFHANGLIPPKSPTPTDKAVRMRFLLSDHAGTPLTLVDTEGHNLFHELSLHTKGAKRP
jgi:hypothetical protein